MSILTKSFRGAIGVVRNLPLMLGSATAGWLTYSAVRRRDDFALPDPFSSDRRHIDSLAAGDIALHESTSRNDHDSKEPVLLVHSVNAAASSMEMRPLFQAFEHDRYVVAMDLPGFGHSQRGNRQYTPELMADAIAAVLEAIGKPTHVIALSLGSEFAAGAALIRPDLVRSLTLISPTGLGRTSRIQPTKSSPADRILDWGPFAQALYDLLVTKPSIDYFLSRSFVAEVDPGLRTFSALSARQPDSRFAPIAFLKGILFTPDARARLYEPPTAPILVVYDEDAYTDFALLPELVGHRPPSVSAKRIANTHGLPHFDRPEETIGAITRFWKEVEAQ